MVSLVFVCVYEILHIISVLVVCVGYPVPR